MVQFHKKLNVWLGTQAKSASVWESLPPVTLCLLACHVAKSLTFFEMLPPVTLRLLACHMDRPQSLRAGWLCPSPGLIWPGPRQPWPSVSSYECPWQPMANQKLYRFVNIALK